MARVERSSERVSKGAPFDTEQFLDVLHLKNGEVIPCQVSFYDENTLSFQSPFIRGRKIDTAHVKGIEFTGGTSGAWNKDTVIIEGMKFEHALTVPRFKRDNPPNHILVAKTDDLKRGNLLVITSQTIQFESKLRELTVPVNRVARVVDVRKPEEDTDEPATVTDDPEGTVRATLYDGSILMFEAIESRDGRLLGRSPIYGEMSIPTESFQQINFGGFEKRTSSLYLTNGSSSRTRNRNTVNSRIHKERQIIHPKHPFPIANNG